MTVAVTLDLPTEIYTQLRQLATSAEQTPEEWILANLRQQLLQSQLGQQRDQNLRRHFGAVDLGSATGADNQSIDADLALAYTTTHEPT